MLARVLACLVLVPLLLAALYYVNFIGLLVCCIVVGGLMLLVTYFKLN